LGILEPYFRVNREGILEGSIDIQQLMKALNSAGNLGSNSAVLTVVEHRMQIRIQIFHCTLVRKVILGKDVDIKGHK
jgi:hypothetical protein